MHDNYKELEISGIYEVSLPVFSDNRGYFTEIVQFPVIEQLTGTNFSKGQWNESCSVPKVIRAIHRESQSKLIRPFSGEVFIALVDLRPKSKTFLKHITRRYNATEEKRVFYLPEGVGNSICVTGSEKVYYHYIVSSLYKDTKMLTIKYDDPDIGISWPVKEPIISDRDKNGVTVREAFPRKFK